MTNTSFNLENGIFLPFSPEATGVGVPGQLAIWTTDNKIGPAGVPSTAGFSFTQSGAGAITRTAQSKMQDVVNVLDFGADPTGVINAQPAFAAAIAALPNGGMVNYRGTFLFTSTLVIPGNIIMQGSGVGSAIIQGSGSSNLTLFQVGDGTSNPSSVEIHDTTFQYLTAQTSGAAMWVRNGHGTRISRVRTLGTNHHASLILDGGAQQFIYDVDDFEFSNGAYGIVVGPNGNAKDVRIGNGVIGSCSVAGISVQDAGGLYGINVDIISSTVGMEIIPGNGQSVYGVNLYGYFLDTSTNRGLSIVPTGTGLVYTVQFIGLWASTTTTASSTSGMGVYINGANAKDISFTGGDFFNNRQSGVQIDAGSYISFCNCRVSANSQAGSASYPGYAIAAAVSHITITGGLAGGSTVTVFNNLQSYGISVAAGASTDLAFTGVDVGGNVTGAISNGATGARVNIIGCPGYLGNLLPQQLTVTEVDGTPWFFGHGATKGVRWFSTSSTAIVEGVDNLGTSYEPLQLGGLSLIFTASGTSVGDYNVTHTGGWSFLKKLFATASTTSAASVNIPSGTAPTSPVDGDMWYDGTNLKFRVGATTKTVTLT